MPFTSNKGFSIQNAGDTNWGDGAGTPTAGTSTPLNEGVIELMDQALAGITSLSLSSSNVTLTQVQAQNAMLRMTGLLSANVSILATSVSYMTGFYYFENLTTNTAYTVTFTNSAGSVVLPQSRRGIMWVDTTNGPRVIAVGGSTNADPIPTGSRMIFYNGAVPSGWAAYTVLNDYGIKIVSSAASAGVSSGSVNYSTLFARTATDSHTLTTNEIPSHTHDVKYSPNSFAGGGAPAVQSIASSGSTTASAAAIATGGGAGHTHDIDMRVRTAAVFIAVRA